MEFALSQAVASGGAFEHRTSEGGHGVQDFLAELYLGDRPGEAVGLESGADDALPTADLRFYPAGPVVPFEDMTGLGIGFEAGPGRGLDERWWESARERSGGMEHLRKHSPVATSEECVEGG